MPYRRGLCRDNAAASYCSLVVWQRPPVAPGAMCPSDGARQLSLNEVRQAFPVMFPDKTLHQTSFGINEGFALAIQGRDRRSRRHSHGH